nr:MAG TPA: hypothetical protein [Caudoviricetes sp.]
MKIWIDGVSREATPEEIAEFEFMAAEQPVPEPTAEERLAALEEAMLELLGVSK